MEEWHCPNCKYVNSAEISIMCKVCQTPRPRRTLPEDLVFPLYKPVDPMLRWNKDVGKMEAMLEMVPIIRVGIDDVEEHLKTEIKKEREAASERNDPTEVNLTLIKTISDFLEMWNDMSTKVLN